MLENRKFSFRSYILMTINDISNTRCLFFPLRYDVWLTNRNATSDNSIVSCSFYPSMNKKQNQILFVSVHLYVAKHDVAFKIELQI